MCTYKYVCIYAQIKKKKVFISHFLREFLLKIQSVLHSPHRYPDLKWAFHSHYLILQWVLKLLPFSLCQTSKNAFLLLYFEDPLNLLKYIHQNCTNIWKIHESVEQRH